MPGPRSKGSNATKSPGHPSSKTRGASSSPTAPGSSKKGRSHEASMEPVKNQGSSNRQAAGSQQRDDTPKKPDTRALIGGASWTGKLPVTLLSEHCQKQGWQKPEYTMIKLRDGFLSSVILKSLDKKTRESTSLPPIRLPETHKALATQATALEARHLVAAFALFRVCSMKNMQVMLPPAYRKYWTDEFQAIKQADLQSRNESLYAADPFQARKERAILAEPPRAYKQAVSASCHGIGLDTGGQLGKPRAWSDVPSVDLGKKMRFQIQDILRRYATWNRFGSTIACAQRETIIKDLLRQGFRQSHIEEAVSECGDQEEARAFLLTYLPEDDLPLASLPRNYVAGVSLANSNLAREKSLKRLCAGGYSAEMCERALEQSQNSEAEAAEALQSLLIQDQAGSSSNPTSVQGPTDSQSMWDEEVATLHAILGERIMSLSSLKFSVDLQPIHLHEKFALHVQKSKTYPMTEPVINLVETKLPAYIKLSITRQAIAHARCSYLGESMIFHVITWLEDHMYKVIENPGQLRELSGVSVMSPAADCRRGGIERTRKPVQAAMDPKAQARESQRILQAWEKRPWTDIQKKSLCGRQKLPAWALKDDIAAAVAQNQVTIVAGETGSGKSTQTVQFILDDLIVKKLGSTAKIICTQPRRISAFGLATRVSEERGSPLGEEVGYSIRGESLQKSGITKIVFMTTGVLLRRLTSGGRNSTEMASTLLDISHIIIDEVHERSTEMDFLLTLLREVQRACATHKPRLVLMSATLDSQIFENYFSHGPANLSVGRVSIPGRMFEIEDYYLDDVLRLTGYDRPRRREEAGKDEDGLAAVDRSFEMQINYELLAAIIAVIDNQLLDDEGSILVFMPGEPEIHRATEAIRRLSGSRISVLPLHGSLPPTEQRRVFLPSGKGQRKVVVATNIAETSITIDDIVAVVDTGRVKEKSLDSHTNISRFSMGWASRAACHQRRGRAGRVRRGKYFRLFTRATEQRMAARPDPEITRVPLESLCLLIRAIGEIDILAFLERTPTPPRVSAVRDAIDVLRRTGALEGDHLTALGLHMSTIPTDLRCSKLLILGALFGCIESCVVIASILSARSPFHSSSEQREEAKTIRSTFAAGHGDVIADFNAYREWKRKRGDLSRTELRAWCSAHCLSLQTMEDITSNCSQFLADLKETGFVSVRTTHQDLFSGWFHANSANLALLRALVAGAFSPQIARVEMPEQLWRESVSGAVAQEPEARAIKYYTRDSGRVFVHPSSTLFDAQGFPGGSIYVAYFSRISTSKPFIRDLTPFNAFSLLLFCGTNELDALGRGLLVDGWLRLKGWARIGVLVNRLRGVLDELLEQKLRDPAADLGGHEIVQTAIQLVGLNGMDE